MKDLEHYEEDWYECLEHFYSKSEWVADLTIAYKNKEARKYA